ncbi:kinesin-like protein KIN-6 [Cornus florida]|uniref:kinesin-like protein KIN-6 n=1 Tax=Cornus florida TaxID=4283 RepID=UPI00289CFB70|nr:kinesin-like protein KIN-6 [Cornus florida]
MEMKSPPPCPNTVTVRRNPPRKARATPSTCVPLPIPLSSPSIPQDIPSFPIQDILSIQVPQNPNILSIQVPQNPNSDLSTASQSSLSEAPLSENFKVFLRIRPLTSNLSSEKHSKKGAQTCKSRTKNAWPQNPTTRNASKTKIKKKSEICVTVNDSNSVTLRPPPAMQDVKRIKSEVYEGFSHVFTANSSQGEVYVKMVNPLVEDFMRGKSGMLAAMGPSGSGKTHTVFGCPREPGMVPLALRRIFSLAQDSGIQSSRSFYLSMFEIYSEGGKAERMVDLSQDGGDLCLQQSMIKGLQEVIIFDVQQAESLIARGMLKRATAMTNSNNQSSRSQCIINIHSSPNKMDGEVDVQSRSAVLTIVDLAGAEREKRTGNQGARLLESNFINNTSMVFGLCLRSLLEHQKNPKKPLQKHFQSSLLTRYLRDYMEGKKRMSLILTVKSGEDDYVDTSFLLRQASPYMQIKFNNVEMLDSLCNKRRFHTSKREQLKRMKFSSLEACVIDEGKDAGDKSQLHEEELIPVQIKEVEPSKVLDYLPRVINLETTDGASLAEDCIEFAKRDRENQIMQGFAKALWNVLKQYKNKLEVSENEIQSLRKSLANEKDRCSDLENQMRNLKPCCSRGKEVSVEVPLVKVDSRTYATPELEHCQSTDVNEVGAGVSSINLKKSEFIDSDQICDTAASNSDVVAASCLGVEKFGQAYQKHKKFHGNVDNAEVLKNTLDMGREDTCINDDATDSSHSESVVSSKNTLDMGREDTCTNDDAADSSHSESVVSSKNTLDMGREDTCTNDDATDSSHSESVISSSQSHVMIRDDNYSTVVENQLQDEEDKKWLDEPVLLKEDLAFAQGCDDGNAPENESKLPQGCDDSGHSESVVSTSQSFVLIKDDSWSSMVENQLQDEEDKKWLDEPENESKLSQGCDVSNVPRSEQKLISCSKPRKAEKPKRRLLPASPSLLKNIVGSDFEDEREKAKGTKGENKFAAADESKRTQGSINLRHLLKTNLHPR